MNPAPSIPDLRIKPDGGVPVVNSRDVAEVFGKRHADVLRDIGAILSTNADLRSSHWFRPASYQDTKGEDRPSFDLTRDGFTLLVMGWTGAKAMIFKVAYIQAFNAMEETLRSPPVSGGMSGADVLAAIREMGQQNLAQVREFVQPLTVRFDGQDQAVTQLKLQVGDLTDDVTQIKNLLVKRRRNISPATKAEHVYDTLRLGGRCPNCRTAIVLDENGIKSPFAEFDHFFENSNPSPDHTWLICKPCHKSLTTGKAPRQSALSNFSSYQDTRYRLPDRQVRLF